MPSAGTDRDRRRIGFGVARGFWGRLRTRGTLDEQHERLVTTEEFRRLRRVA